MKVRARGATRVRVFSLEAEGPGALAALRALVDQVLSPPEPEPTHYGGHRVIDVQPSAVASRSVPDVERRRRQR